MAHKSIQETTQKFLTKKRTKQMTKAMRDIAKHGPASAAKRATKLLKRIDSLGR